MRAALAHTDELLKGLGPFHPDQAVGRQTWWLAAMVVAFAALYGGVMGSFHFHSPERLWQVIFASLKAPLLLFATGLICLPGFFAINTVAGLRDDFREAYQAILAGQAGLSVALASLAPLTRFWYFSTDSYRAALLFNVAVFTVAALAGQIVMFRYYRVLIRRDPRHRIMLYLWLALYAFVGIQMAWVLRPFVGSPDMPVSFFRAEAFSNAYVVVARLIFGG